MTGLLHVANGLRKFDWKLYRKGLCVMPVSSLGFYCTPSGSANLRRVVALFLSLNVLFLSTELRAANACAARTHTLQLKALPRPPRQGVTFEPDGPMSLDILLDDDGKPVKVRGKDNRYVQIQGHISWWKTSNGERVSAYYLDLVSPSFASEYLKKRLQNAKVIERGARTDGRRHATGERIVALLYLPTEPHKRGPQDPHKTVAAVIRTAGTKYWEFLSNSVEDSIALEQHLARVSIDGRAAHPR